MLKIADPATDGLQALSAQARRELEYVAYPARPWRAPALRAGQRVHDVVIVGAGQNGIATAFALRRARVDDVVVLDRCEPGFEGPWLNYARMHTLRTPKHVSGPEMGIPSLSVQAWFEAQHGPQAWSALGKLPRQAWQDYLVWLRATTGIAVEHGASVVDIEPLDDGVVAVHTSRRRWLARKVVLATGIEGCGAWFIPEEVRRALPPGCYAHTAEAIDFSALAGRRVAVVGAGASAFDNAAMALEAGAAAVTVYARRRSLPAVNPYRWMEFYGFLRHFADLDDARKWRFMTHTFAINQPPPQETFDRCRRFPQFSLRLGAPIVGYAYNACGIRLDVCGGTAEADFLILATGLVTDLAARPELRRIAPDVALWRDRFAPARQHGLGGFPYLGPNLELLERQPGERPGLTSIFANTFAAMPSAASSAGISSLRFTVGRIVDAITRDLFLADADRYLASFEAYDERDFSPLA